MGNKRSTEMRKNDTGLNLMPSVVSACCILHNICVQDEFCCCGWNIVMDQPDGAGQPHAVVYEGERSNTANSSTAILQENCNAVRDNTK